MKKYLKWLFVISIFFLSLTGPNVSYAAIDCDLQSECTIDGAACAPKPTHIVCIIMRVINFGVLIVGIITMAMIAYAAIKMAMAMGDPKGFQGSVKTLQYAGIGFMIVISVFLIIRLINGMFGLNLGDNFNLGEILVEKINEVLITFWVWENP